MTALSIVANIVVRTNIDCTFCIDATTDTVCLIATTEEICAAVTNIKHNIYTVTGFQNDCFCHKVQGGTRALCNIKT